MITLPLGMFAFVLLMLFNLNSTTADWLKVILLTLTVTLVRALETTKFELVELPVKFSLPVKLTFAI